jgi:hypothetical protein
MSHHVLQFWKHMARAANKRGNQFLVGHIIGLRLESLFGDDHRAAHRFYTELEQSASTTLRQEKVYK